MSRSTQKQRKKTTRKRRVLPPVKVARKNKDDEPAPKLQYNYRSEAFKIRQKLRKNRLIRALKEHYGVISAACEAAGITRKSFYKYYREDEEFKTRADDAQDIALDHAESQLHKNIKAGKEISLLFYLKCKGKGRGYLEKGDDSALVVNVMPSEGLTPESLV